MDVLYERCAGLDVHKRTVVACRVKAVARGQKEQELRTFGTTTPELLQLVDWLLQWGCTHVAMESTGDFWKPIHNLLEGQIEVLLVNAQHVKHVPSRKTDVQDAEWLAELLRHGLLKPSFIPPKPQRELRDLTRYRTTVVQERTRVVLRVQKGLEAANIKLASVVSDTLGVSGRAILQALVAGQTDPAQLAELARGRLRAKIPQLQNALTGVVGSHHRFLLAQQLAHIDFLDEEITALEGEIARQLEAMSPPPSVPPAPDHLPDRSATAASAPPTFLQAVALLDTIPGIHRTLAEVIVAELGPDMSRFPSARHAAAWAGLAPGNHESAGKRYPRGIRPGNQALRSSLVQAAWVASRTRDTYLAAQYHRLSARRGKKRAVVAIAHSILVMAYHMLRRGRSYQELGGNTFDERQKSSLVNHLLRRIQKLGYSARLEPTPAAASPGG